MIEGILIDLARLDQLERDHKSDSIAKAKIIKSREQLLASLSACDKAMVQERIGRRAEEGKLAIEKEEHAKTKKQLKVQKVLKWLGFGVAAIATAVALVIALTS